MTIYIHERTYGEPFDPYWAHGCHISTTERNEAFTMTIGKTIHAPWIVTSTAQGKNYWVVHNATLRWSIPDHIDTYIVFESTDTKRSTSPSGHLTSNETGIMVTYDHIYNENHVWQPIWPIVDRGYPFLNNDATWPLTCSLAGRPTLSRSPYQYIATAEP